MTDLPPLMRGHGLALCKGGWGLRIAGLMWILLALAVVLAAPMAGRAAERSGFAEIENPNLALGLNGVSDWTVQQPFLDVMKTARPWFGEKEGVWDALDEAALGDLGALGAGGWPQMLPAGVGAISTLILTDLPQGAGGVAGRYVLAYEGQGAIEVSGRAKWIRAQPGRITFDYTPGPGFVQIRLTQIDAQDPLHAIKVFREDREHLLDRNELFNPDWLSRIAGVQMLRFMDWMRTNDSPVQDPGDRPKVGDYTWARRGVPLEVVVALANRLGAEPWVNVPHLASDDLVTEMAEIIARDLDPSLRVWVEYSNEVWNWQFAQATWAEAQGRALWGVEGAWVQFYAHRAREVMQIWSQILPVDRRVRVIATQTGWLGLEQMILAPPLMGAGAAHLGAEFDAYAIAGYFSGGLGWDAKAPMLRDWLAQSAAMAEAEAGDLDLGLGGARAAYVAAHRYDLALMLAGQEMRDGRHSGLSEDTLLHFATEVLPYHAAVAQAQGLTLAMYEGGSHVAAHEGQREDQALVDFLTAVNYSAEMGEIYKDLMGLWQEKTPAPFNAFVDVAQPSKWGNWGHLRHLDDDNPRWQALIADPASPPANAARPAP